MAPSGGCAISAGLLEVDADLSVCGALYGTARKRGAQQVAAEALESFAVVAINRDGCMQLHAEGRAVAAAYGAPGHPTVRPTELV